MPLLLILNVPGNAGASNNIISFSVINKKAEIVLATEMCILQCVKCSYNLFLNDYRKFVLMPIHDVKT